MKNNKLLIIIIYTTSLIAALLGILALIGWFMGNTSLIKINTSFVSMQFNTALSFLFSGVGLFCLVNNNLLIGKSAIILVGIISFFTIIEYLSGINIGFYEIFINHTLKNQTSHPNQIVLNTVLPFLFFSIATVLSTSTKRYKIFIGLISSLVFSIGLIGLASYITRDGFNYGWEYLFQMSVHSTFGFIALGIGLTALTTLFGTRKKNVYPWIIGYTIGLTVTLFLIDISLPLQVSGISYVLLIMLGWFIPTKRIIIILTVIATFFLTMGYFIVKKESIPGFNIFHLLLELIILWIVSVLLYNIKKKEIVLKDINKKLKIAKIEIENREAEFRAITNQSTEGITVADLDGNYTFVNPAFCIMSGYSKEEILKMTVFDMKAKNQSHLSFYESKENMEGKPITVTLQRKDKTEYIGEVIGKNIIIGKEHLVLGIIRNVTEFKKAEKKLLESEFRLTQAQKVANLGFYMLDIKNMTWTSSKVLDNIFGVNKSFVRNINGWINIVHPEDREEMITYFENNILKKHEKFDKQYRIIKINNKKECWVHGLGELEFDAAGNPTRMIGTIQNITPQKKTQLQLEEAYSQVNQLKNQLEIENINLKEEISLAFNYEDLVYSSLEISEVLTQVDQVSATDATVLVLGETGTGKELIAKAIHKTSDRKNNPLIRINCATIPAELIESELFGHVKGAFTGAIKNRVGKFELANTGTLFLDEIGELPLALQPKLLRAIQEGEIEPIGSSKIRKLNVRIIAATNKNLKIEVEEKRFREDLYFRLNVFPITIPALRERIEDIPVLINHFVNKYCDKHRKEIKYISDNTLQQMKSYAWPGNVRELENLIERAIIISNQDLLIIKEFEASTQKNSIIKHSSTTLEEVQRNHIIKILNKTHWKISGKEGAARLLDIKPSTLRDRMKKLGIHRPEK